MWAYSLTAPRHFEKVEVPAPQPDELEEGQVLLRTVAGGICGSDLGAFAGHRSPVIVDRAPYAPSYPGYPMHEVVGEVVASRSPLIVEGTLVVGWASAINALAEFVVTAGNGLAPYDAELEATTAVLLQPLACVLEAVDRMGEIDGRWVAVVGQGPIGILFSHVLKQRGARRVTGVDLVDRTDVARAFGVDEPIQASGERWAAQLGDDERPSVVVEAVGHQTDTLADVLEGVASLGLVYYFGIPAFHPYTIDMWKLLRKQVTLRAGTTLSRHRSLVAANEYLRDHPSIADHYVTNTYEVAEIRDAFETASTPAKGRLKVVVSIG